MTVERRLVVGLEDIKAITFECIKCKSRLTLLPETTDWPDRCIQCGQEWIPLKATSPSSKPSSPVTFMLGGLQRLRALMQDTTAGVRVLFEIEEPKP